MKVLSKDAFLTEKTLPSPCTAFSQSLSVNSLRFDHVTRNALAARNIEASGLGKGNLDLDLHKVIKKEVLGLRTTSTRCIKVITHLHDDVTRALHAGICSQEKNKMMAGSGGGFTCCVPGCFTNNERDPHLSFYVFPKKKKLRRRWLHSTSRKSFKPTTGHQVCSLHFKGEKKPT